MQRTQPYRSHDYERARDELVGAIRVVAKEKGLRKTDIMVPTSPKETAATTPPDAIEAKRVLGKEIRRRVDAKGHDQNTLRQAYAPMRKAMFERLRKEGEEGSFGLMRLFQIADALGLKVTVTVR